MQRNGKQTTVLSLPGTIPDRLEPHNFDAEEAVIGGLLIDPDGLIMVTPFLKPEHFFIERLGWVYRAMLELADRNTPADLLTLTDELERRGQLEEIGGRAYISSLLATTPTATYTEHYARIVERDAIRRQLIRSAGEIARLSFDHQGQADELLAQAEKLISRVAGGRGQDNRALPISDIVSEIYDDIDRLRQAGGRAILGLPTGLTKIDALLGGLQRSHLVIIAGRPGMGKSALAGQVAVYAARKHAARSLIFSLEMDKKEFVRRMISAGCGIEENRIRGAQIQEDEWSSYLQAANNITSLPITINDASCWTPAQLRAEVTRHAAKNGLDLIILDYLQLLTGDGRNWQQNRTQEVSEISRTFKTIARELNVPFVALSQLSRRCEERHDKRPMLSDLRESGAIEADADVVLFLYRDVVYNPDTEYPGLAEAIIAKHRGGPTGTVKLFFKKELTQFKDLEERRQPLGSVDFNRSN